MQQVMITKTKQYLIFKIPLSTIQKTSLRLPRVDKAIADGLKAVVAGRTEGPFKSGHEAIAFLRSL
ncbi:hypothetical protein HY625_02025 [Candidatus Uhrbacteria bacterium]|nr:hypothetical protein [Candidatus Uhrbacteria bacterium]